MVQLFGKGCLTVSGPAFSVVRQARGLRGPDAKNQRRHQPIEMKLGMSHYSHKSMPDAKFESSSFSIFVNMTSQNFTLKMNGFNFLNNELLCPELFFLIQNSFPISNFQAEKNQFFIFKIFETPQREKSISNPPD